MARSRRRRYQARLEKASLHIRTVLGAPDVLCVQEVENVGVVSDLAARIALDDPSLVYNAHLLEGHDVGGIDTGFLVRDTITVDSVTQVGYNTLLSLDGSYLNDRPPLVLQGRYVANGAPFPITVIGVHGRSLSGIEGTSTEANRVRQKRLEQALELAGYIQGLQAADAARRIVVTGDFNAFEFSDGYVDVVGIISGMLDPNGAIQAGHADLVTPDLLELVSALPGGRALLLRLRGQRPGARSHAGHHEPGRLRQGVRVRARQRRRSRRRGRPIPSTPLRTSDHDGMVLFVMTDADGDGVPDDMEEPAAVRGDFTGDLKSDMLWRHATQGDVWVWPMNGPALTAETYVRTVADTNWEIRGQGDQDGDGDADILWRNKVTGEIYFWPMTGTTPDAEIYVGTVDPAYDIAGTGDFDADGKSDIVWRNFANGEVWIWLMDGATPKSEVYVDTVDPGYVIKGVGDLDANGKADIVWHHATLGEVWVWQMNGTTRLSETWVATVPDTGYQIAGLGDFDGNGTADMVWHHATLGEVWIWPMNGAARLSETYVETVPDTGYRIASTGDYDGDGKSDILWHHATRGEVWVWLMDGPVKASENWVATVPDTGYRDHQIGERRAGSGGRRRSAAACPNARVEEGRYPITS